MGNSAKICVRFSQSEALDIIEVLCELDYPRYQHVWAIKKSTNWDCYAQLLYRGVNVMDHMILLVELETGAFIIYFSHTYFVGNKIILTFPTGIL